MRPSILFVVALSGCAFIPSLRPEIEPPTATFVRAAVQKLSLEAITVAGTFEVENPSIVELDLRNVSFQVYVRDTPILRGAEALDVRLARDAVTEVTIPVEVPLASIRDAAALLGAQGPLPYRVRALGTVRAPWTQLPLELEWTGELPRAGLL